MAAFAASRSPSRRAMPARTAKARVMLGVDRERLLERASRPRRSRRRRRASGAPSITSASALLRGELQRLARAPPRRRRDRSCRRRATPTTGASRRAVVRRAHARLERGGGVLGVAQQVHRATHHGEALGVAGGDDVVVVLVDELHQHGLGVGASSRTDEELAQHEAHASPVDAAPGTCAHRAARSPRRACPATREPAHRARARPPCYRSPSPAARACRLRRKRPSARDVRAASSGVEGAGCCANASEAEIASVSSETRGRTRFIGTHWCNTHRRSTLGGRG